MNVTCAECASIFRVDPAKVPGGGVRARCSVCGAIIAVAAPVPAEVEVPVAAAPSIPTPATPPGATPAVALPRAVPQPGAAQAAAPPPPPPAPGAPRSPDPSGEGAARIGPRIMPRTDPTPAGAATAQRRVNPYLSNDPSQKARRLARALVSDLVVYQPQKREEGLRAGTLKELFRDEIRKSWEEYVAQVGAPIAESTTHFQDALNDVLAGGRKIF